jgi:hypothetical protein
MLHLCVLLATTQYLLACPAHIRQHRDSRLKQCVQYARKVIFALKDVRLQISVLLAIIQQQKDYHQ